MPQLTVRFSEDLDAALEAASRRLHRKRSEVVRMALQSYLGLEESGRSAERVRSLLGSLESGVPDLAENHRRYVLESLRRAE